MLRLFCFILHTYTKKYCSNPQGNLTKKKKQNPIVEIDRDQENSTKSPKSGNTGYLLKMEGTKPTNITFVIKHRNGFK